MDRRDQLEELLVDWEQQRRQGNELTVEELCKDHPEIVADLSQLIADFKATDWLEEDDESEDDFLRLSNFSTFSGHVDDTRLPVSGTTLEQFCQRVIESGLMDADDVAQYRTLYPATDALAFAQQLVKGKKLTRFQSTVLLEGRDLPLVLDRYLILDEIGAGGMGAVYKALHQQMDRVVALKILPRSVVDSSVKIKRFQREVKAAARLEHANIVTAFDAHESKGTHFLVMSYIDGQDLAKLVRRNGPLSAAKAVHYIAQAARGLDHAHQLGITHRDIKPANLLLDKKGVVKILDMGLARIESADADVENTVSQELTQAGMLMGTVAYLAPEQALDTRHADARSDMYSLGCTLYYLLTGRPVYAEDTIMKTLLAHRERDIPSLPSDRVSAELDLVFRRMVAKRPEDRFQSMTELLDALERLTLREENVDDTQRIVPSSETIHDSDTIIDTSQDIITPAPAAAQPPRRRNWNRAILAGCLLGMAGLGWAFAAGIFLKVETKAGTIILEIDQPELAGAEVSVDGQQKITIKTGESQELIEVVPDEKTHTLKVAKGGFEAFVTTFTVKAGKEQTIKVRLEPLNGHQASSPAESSANTWALEFDGNDDYVESSASMCDPRTPFTFELWFTANESVKKTETLLSAFAPSQQCSVGLQLDRPKNSLTFSVGDSRYKSASHYSFDRQGSFQVRHHAALVWDTSDIHIYIDGKQQSSATTRLPTKEGDSPHPDLTRFTMPTMLIGAGLASPDSDEFFKGRIDEIRVSNVARYSENFTPKQRFAADEQTVALYHLDAGVGDSIYDSSGNGHHGKIYGAKWIPHSATVQDTEHQIRNRSVAEWVLSIGGWIATPESKIENPDALTDDDIVISVMLYSNSQVRDADLERLTALENLVVLALSNTNISDAGIDHISRIRTLELLDLQGSQVTGKGLRRLAALRSLRTVWANGLQVSNFDVEALAACPRIEELSLSDPAITEYAVVFLKSAKSLRSLNLHGTSVSAAGKAEIEMAIPGCRVK